MRVFCTCVWFYWKLDKQATNNVEGLVYDGALGRFSSRYDELFMLTESNVLDRKIMWFKQRPPWIWFKWLFIRVLFPFQFSDVILYTSRGMTPTNQFKVHGQLPLHGMTVSFGVSHFNKKCFKQAVTSLSLLQMSLLKQLNCTSFNVYPPNTHTHTHTRWGQLHVLLHHFPFIISLFLSILVAAVLDSAAL